MLFDDLVELHGLLGQFKEELIRNRVEPFRKEAPDRRAFRVRCVTVAMFNIQNYHIPAVTRGEGRTSQRDGRWEATITNIWESGFFEWRPGN